MCSYVSRLPDRNCVHIMVSVSAKAEARRDLYRLFFDVLLNAPPFILIFQPLTSLELWQMVKQHYGQDLGLSHEEMDRLQLSAESSMQTR